MLQLCCYLMRVWSWMGVCNYLLSPLIWEWLVKASSLTQWDQPSWVEGTHPCSRPARTHTLLHREKDATVESEHTSLCKWTIHMLASLLLSFHPAPRSPAFPPQTNPFFLSHLFLSLFLSLSTSPCFSLISLHRWPTHVRQICFCIRTGAAFTLFALPPSVNTFSSSNFPCQTPVTRLLLLPSSFSSVVIQVNLLSCLSLLIWGMKKQWNFTHSCHPAWCCVFFSAVLSAPLLFLSRSPSSYIKVTMVCR